MQFEIALIQSTFKYENPIGLLEKMRINHRAPMIALLPELWVCGFNRDALRIAADNYFNYVEKIKSFCRKNEVAVAGTLPIMNFNNKFFNQFIFVTDSGELKERYNKMHLFPLTKENNFFDAGENPVFFEYYDTKIGVSICYDLRFPELFRSYVRKEVTLILLSACFPRPRLFDWKTLLSARAIENQVYIAAANAVESELIDNDSVEYFGHSSLVSPSGQIMEELGESEQISYICIDMSEVVKTRQLVNYSNDIRNCY